MLRQRRRELAACLRAGWPEAATGSRAPALALAADHRLAAQPRLAVLPTLTDGLRKVWIDVLLDPNGYRTTCRGSPTRQLFRSTFTHFIACGDGVDGTNVWTTHVAGHPPLATLVFWLLARVGLGGGSWHVGIVANSGLALLRGRESRWALATAAGWAILVNHLFNTGW